MKAFKGIFFLVLFTAGLSRAGFGQDLARLTLEEALSRALENHPALQRQEGEIGASKTRLSQARSGFFPQISAAGSGKQGLSGTTGALGLPGGLVSSPFFNDVATSAVVYQNLYDFGRIEHQTESARLLSGAAEVDMEVIRERVVYEVRRTYLDALRNQSLIALDERITGERRLRFRKANALYEAGLRSKLDVSLAEAQLRQAEADLTQHREDLHQSFAELNRAMGLNTSREYALEELAGIESGTVGSVEDLVSAALNERPEIRSMGLQLEAARAAVEAAESERFPLFRAMWSGGYARFADFSLGRLMVGALGFGLPLFTGGRLEAKVDEQRYHVRILESDLENLKQAIRLEVSQAVADLRTYQNLLPVLKDLIRVLQESVDLADARYRSGLSSFLDVLTAQTAWAEAETNYTQTLYQSQEAEFRLRFAVGSRK